MPPACFWYSKRRVKGKSVWTSLLMRDPENGEANLLIPQNLPSQGRNDPSAITCSCFLLFLHLVSGYILTAVLWRSFKSGREWRQWAVEASSLQLLCTWAAIWIATLLSSANLPPASAQVHSDLHRWLGRAALWLENSHSQQQLRIVNLIPFQLQQRKITFCFS